MPRVQVAEATQRVEARYEDALDSAVLRGVAARTRLVPQAIHPSHIRPIAERCMTVPALGHALLPPFT